MSVWLYLQKVITTCRSHDYILKPWSVMWSDMENMTIVPIYSLWQRGLTGASMCTVSPNSYSTDYIIPQVAFATGMKNIWDNEYLISRLNQGTNEWNWDTE